MRFCGANRVDLRTHNGKLLHVSGISASDPIGDLAIIELQQPDATERPFLTVAADAPRQGERLFAIASPLGLEWSASEGIVSAIRAIPNVGVVIQHTVPTSIGSSGCPLINFRGEVVAVQTAILTAGQKTVSAGQGLNFASPASRIAALKPGASRTLGQCLNELARDWVAPITRGIDELALYPLTRDDFKSGLAFFQACVTSEPEEPDAWFRLGLCEEKIGNTSRAEEAYRKAIDLKSISPVPFNNLAVLCIQRGDYGSAVGLLERAVEMKAGYSEALASLALAHLQLKNYPAAIDAANRALQANPNYAEARFTLGQAYLRNNQRDKALEQCHALAQVDKPKAEELKRLIEAAGENTTQP